VLSHFKGGGGRIDSRGNWEAVCVPLRGGDLRTRGGVLEGRDHNKTKRKEKKKV